MKKNSLIFLAGHRGLVGSAIKKNLESRGYTNIITRTHSELDLTNQQAVEQFFKAEKPEYVFLAAAKVGGIVANNTYRGEFIYDNLMIQNNVIHHSYLNGVKKLLFLGSTCIYPKNAPQPMKEEYLLTDTLEYTNEPYAIAKIAGIKMCESYNIQYNTNFIAVQPTNLYGPNDNFDLEKSHVLPALIRKIHLGKALENNDWSTIKKDLNNLPIEGIDGKSSNDEILNILSTNGVRLCEQSEAISSPASPTGGLKTQEKLNTSQPLGGDVRRTEGVQSESGISPPQPSPKGEGANTSSSKDLPKAEGVQVEIWGSGKPLREFLWSEDMADACVYIMEQTDFNDLVFPSKSDHREGAAKEPHEIKNTHVNIGTGKEISIKQLAEIIKDTVGFKGDLYFNASKPDGTMRKLTDSSKLEKLGWKYTVELEEGIERMYRWYLSDEV